jgi:hypothetical protein
VTSEQLKAAIKLFQLALQRDPTYEPAKQGLAMAQGMLAHASTTAPATQTTAPTSRP